MNPREAMFPAAALDPIGVALTDLDRSRHSRIKRVRIESKRSELRYGAPDRFGLSEME